MAMRVRADNVQIACLLVGSSTIVVDIESDSAETGRREGFI
jgi:hypothetical protein